MQFIDTHSHMYSSKFDEDRKEAIDRAIKQGVDKIFLPNIDSSSIEGMHDLESAFPDNCFAMMGLHPCSVKENYEEELAIVKKHLAERPYKAIGEIGIDLHWDKSTLAIQQDAFKRQIEWAKENKLPIVIHARESFNEIFEIVDELNDDSLWGIFHCFTGSIEQAEKIISYGGFKMGIGGVLTYKNSGLAETIAHVDLKHLVLETDAPYLSPKPHRGKRNETSYTYYVAEKLAEVKGVSLSEIAEATSRNAHEVFDFQ